MNKAEYISIFAGEANLDQIREYQLNYKYVLIFSNGDKFNFQKFPPGVYHIKDNFAYKIGSFNYLIANDLVRPN